MLEATRGTGNDRAKQFLQCQQYGPGFKFKQLLAARRPFDDPDSRYNDLVGLIRQGKRASSPSLEPNM